MWTSEDWRAARPSLIGIGLLLLALFVVLLLVGCGEGEQRSTSTATTTEKQDTPVVKITKDGDQYEVRVRSAEQADEICSAWQSNWPGDLSNADQVFFFGPNGDTLITCAAP